MTKRKKQLWKSIPLLIFIFAFATSATANSDSSERTTNTNDVASVNQTGEKVATDLFISEYVHGSGKNEQYLEIYNGTGKTVNLRDYRVRLYKNKDGSTTLNNNFRPGGPDYQGKLELENGKVYVLKNPNATIFDGEAEEASVIAFDGRSAIVLFNFAKDANVDIIGRIGDNLGRKEAWTDSKNAELTTKGRTLVRKPSVRSGVTENPSEGFPTLSTEWISYPVDDVSHLGSHTME